MDSATKSVAIIVSTEEEYNSDLVPMDCSPPPSSIIDRQKEENDGKTVPLKQLKWVIDRRRRIAIRYSLDSVDHVWNACIVYSAHDVNWGEDSFAPQSKTKQQQEDISCKVLHLSDKDRNLAGVHRVIQLPFPERYPRGFVSTHHFPSCMHAIEWFRQYFHIRGIFDCNHQELVCGSWS